MKHVSWSGREPNGNRWFACGAIVLGLLGCASGESAQKPAAHPSATTAPAAAAQPAAAPAPAKPTICGVGNTEAEVADEVLAQSGRGLVWLVVPGPDRKERAARGGAEVKAARALAECLLEHWDSGFDPTQSKGYNALEAWVDAHVGPEHAETLLAAGAAYLASMLVAESWIDAALDVPATKLFLERSTAANPELSDGLGPLILGAYECFIPKAVGGQAAVGLKRLQDAWSKGGRLALAMKVAAAELCAFSLQDRALFDRLLDEVEKSPQSDSTFDVIAKSRVKTLRDQVDELFPEM